jgi:hypothetical protein
MSGSMLMMIRILVVLGIVVVVGCGVPVSD